MKHGFHIPGSKGRVPDNGIAAKRRLVTLRMMDDEHAFVCAIGGGSFTAGFYKILSTYKKVVVAGKVE